MVKEYAGSKTLALEESEFEWLKELREGLMRQSWIVVDLDGTLCDESHREEHATRGDWDTYFASLNGDAAYKDVANTIHLLCGTVKVMILTSRPERYRKSTIDWLYNKEIPYDVLLMRPDDSIDGSERVKIEILEEYFGNKETVLSSVIFALEDRDKIVKAFREYGIPCWHVREGRY